MKTEEELEQMVFNSFIEYLILNGTDQVNTDSDSTQINVWDKVAEKQS